jgi:hypothetical protein
VLLKKSKIMGDGKILGSGQPKIGKKKRRIIELK